MTRKITSSANTTMSGRIIELRCVLIHFELKGEAETSSFDARSSMRNTAITAPPMPIPTGTVIETALEAAVVDVVVVVMTVDSINFPQVIMNNVIYIFYDQIFPN